MFLDDSFKKSLQKSHILAFPVQTYPLHGGGNNQVLLVSDSNGGKFVLKCYFQDALQRPRLESEYRFLKYAWQKKLRNIPKPLELFKEQNAAIYSYIEGRAATKEDICLSIPIDFLLALNSSREKIDTLPNAAESCFCLQDYIDTVDKKLLKLRKIEPNTLTTQELKDFLETRFLRKWKKISEKFKTKYKKTLREKISSEEIIITPSDFGFHNAIVSNNQIYFIDFEYAGIDDIAKTVCDFFCQPKVPVPLTYFSDFTTKVLTLVNNPTKCLERIVDLMPICQMKWCCIILNIFHRMGKQRRIFSRSDQTEQKQLSKAKDFLQTIKEEFTWPT